MCGNWSEGYCFGGRIIIPGAKIFMHLFGIFLLFLEKKYYFLI